MSRRTAIRPTVLIFIFYILNIENSFAGGSYPNYSVTPLVRYFRDSRLDAFTSARNDTPSFTKTPTERNFHFLPEVHFEIFREENLGWRLETTLPFSRTTTGQATSQPEFKKNTRLWSLRVGPTYTWKIKSFYLTGFLGVGRNWLWQGYSSGSSNGKLRAQSWATQAEVSLIYPLQQKPGRAINGIFSAGLLGSDGFKSSHGSGIYSDFAQKRALKVDDSGTAKTLQLQTWTISLGIQIAWVAAKPRIAPKDDNELSPPTSEDQLPDLFIEPPKITPPVLDEHEADMDQSLEIDL